MKIKRVAKSFTDLQTTLKLAVSSNKAPDVVEANQGRPIMGQLVKGGLLKPLDAYADAYGWKDRWSKTLLDLNRFTADGKTFGAGNLYGVSQQGEIVGVFYNKDKVKTVPSTFAEFEAMLAKAKKAGETPISFGNLDKFGGIHEFQTVQNQFADKQATRDFVFAKGGASFDTSENKEAATKLQEWAKKGYFTKDFNGTGYDPAWQQFTKGKGPFTIAGTWITNDALKALGLKLGFFLMPGREAGSDPVSLGGESLPWAITSKSKNADVAAAYIDFLTNAEAADVQVETGNLPAMAGERAAQGAGRAGHLHRLEGPQRQRRPDAVHGLRDADVLRRLLGRRAEAAGRQASAGRVHEVRAGGLREVHRHAVTATLAPPGEPRRVAYLYLLPGLVVFGLFVLAPLVHSAWLSLFTWDGVTPGTWNGLGNYSAIVSDPKIRSAFLHALILVAFYAVGPIAIGLLLAAAMSRSRVRGLALFRTVLFLPQVIALVVVAVMWRMIYQPDGGLLNQGLRAIGLGGLTQDWLGSFSLALPSVGLIGTWVMYGLAMVLFTAGVQKIPQSLYDAARMDGAGPVREFFAVTLPGLRNEIAVALTLTTIQALRSFDLVYITTGGGPGDATTVPAFEVYNRAFKGGDVGTASAIGICIAAMIFVLTLVINQVAEREAAR